MRHSSVFYTLSLSVGARTQHRQSSIITSKTTTDEDRMRQTKLATQIGNEWSKSPSTKITRSIERDILRVFCTLRQRLLLTVSGRYLGYIDAVYSVKAIKSTIIMLFHLEVSMNKWASRTMKPM